MNIQDFLISFFSIILSILLIIFGLKVCFIISLKKLLLKIRPENRTIKVHDLWYLLIPFFNLFWNFNVVNKIAFSLKIEYHYLGLKFKENPTSNIGIFWAFSSSFYLVVPFLPFAKDFITFVSFLSIILYFLSTGLFLSYWFVVIEHKKILSLIKEN